MPTITPCLWFDGRVDQAVAFYTAVFGDGVLLEKAEYPDAAGFPAGDTLTATIEIAGQRVMLLNGGPNYTLTPAFSFAVSCADQTEVDRYWDALLDGGEPSQCGWLTDRFGVSWQIVPESLGRLMADPDPDRAKRVTEAMLGMVKLDVAALQAAYDGV